MNPTDIFIGAGSDFGDVIGLLVIVFLAVGGTVSGWLNKRRARKREEERQLRRSRYSAAPAAKGERGYGRPVRAARWQEPSGPCVFGYQH